LPLSQLNRPMAKIKPRKAKKNPLSQLSPKLPARRRTILTNGPTRSTRRKFSARKSLSLTLIQAHSLLKSQRKLPPQKFLKSRILNQ
jgi:hypothetical protein